MKIKYSKVKIQNLNKMRINNMEQLTFYLEALNEKNF